MQGVMWNSCLSFKHITIITLSNYPFRAFKLKKLKYMFLSGIEPETFRVLGGCDNHYTTETTYVMKIQLIKTK